MSLANKTELKKNTMRDWIKVNNKIENSIIKTLHTDGKEDVCRVIDGHIYSFDPKTEAPITHYKIITLLTPSLLTEGRTK